MRTYYFDPVLPKLVAARFPNVEDFHIDYNAANVKPVEYDNGRGIKSDELPLVVRWRIGSQRYAYVMKPTFKVEQREICPFLGLKITNVRADYSADDVIIWKLLQWSVEGKTADDMNRIIENFHHKAK